MKRTLTPLLAIAAAFALAVPAQGAITDDLVGYYDGSSNANSGLASDGDSLTNIGIGTGAAASSVAGGDAFQFDGTGSDNLTALTSYGAGATDLGETFTIQAWYNIDDSADPSGNSGDRSFIWENSSDFDFSYWIDEDGGTVSTGNVDGNGAMFVDNATTNFSHIHTFAGNQWDHVLQTIVTDAGTTTVTTYINGALAGSDTTVTADAGASGGLTDTGINFGRARDSASDRPLDGLIDEVAIWDRELTQAEITELYNRGVNGFALDESLVFAFNADDPNPQHATVTLTGWNDNSTFTPVGGAGNDLGDGGFEDEYYRTTTSGDNTIKIELTDLPSHAAINLGMIVAQLDSLDPDRDDDRFIVKLDGVEILSVGLGYGTSVDTVFNDEVVFDVVINGVSAADSVIEATETLGGVDLFSSSNFLEHMYDLGLLDAFNNIAHSADTLTLEIIGRQNQNATGENYGVDNITITLIPTPAALPAGLAILGMLAAHRRRS